MNVSRSRVHRDRRPATTHSSDYTLAFLNPSLDGGRHGMIDGYSSGIRRNIYIERCSRWNAQVYVPGAGANAPHVGGRSVGANVAAAGLGTKSAFDAAHGDISGSGACIDVALAHLFDFDITAAGFEADGTGDLASADVARAGLEMKIASDAREFHVARTGFEIYGALHPFDPLVATAAMAAHGGVFGDDNLIIDGDVSVIDIVDTNIIAILPEWRILL